ncbi:MAG: carboxypeptidase regulatory-like domain-containing protein, partial [Chloroflexi bacterium]|nr:carboxypeptidase regulatory-like domain-containing protein [Chloroflexota bacterium]
MIVRLAMLGGLAVVLLGACGREEPQPAVVEAAIAMDADDIAGFVHSTAGPEAGVWVIAETDDFDTRFARIVVTDDEG